MKWLTHLFRKQKKTADKRPPQIFLTNTLSGKKELFISRRPGVVLLYTCGPTVYGPQHIGNLRPGITADILTRTFSRVGYRVRRVMNITDVGHLTDNGDEGEDKMEIGARRDECAPEEIAQRYATRFINDLGDLAIDTADIRFPRASEYIREQIALAKTLEEKGFAYRIKSGLYFETSRFPGYGALGNLAGAALVEGARVAKAEGKRHPSDFALWRTAKPEDLQQWDSPWGRGNPGWHLECSAMVRALLGPEIDIHTGGEDLIMTHHNDEIAQSEAASGRPFVRYWLHNAFLTMGGEKVAKSLGNVVYLSDIVEKGFHPLSLRYLFLQAHYRTPLSFSWDALAGAAEGLERLWKISRGIANESKRTGQSSEARKHFLIAMRDDLATPQALGLLWDSLKSEDYTPEEKWGLLEDAEAHLGLSLLDPHPIHVLGEEEIPKKIQDLLTHRENARASQDFKEADRIRNDIERGGYHVDDGPHGPVLTRTAL